MRQLAHAGIALLPLAVVMAALGWWQIERMNEKHALVEQFENAEYLALDAALERDAPFARVSATGRFDTERHVLLDNQVLEGRAGVHVFTLFQNFDGTHILVNRGWKPMAADRRTLPDIWTPSVPVSIRGILAPPPAHGPRLGEPDRLGRDEWPQLVTYLEIGRVADALGAPLPERIVWLSAEDPAGFDGRDWSPVVMTPERHRAYAVQWFALAIAALVTWLVLAVRARKAAAKPEGSA